jgi:hypothetical protein
MSKIITALVLGGALAGALFLTTHHTETVKESCKYSADADGIMCDFIWVRN